MLNFKKPVDLTGYTLVIPSISVGNVPQLTVDLLISTLQFENIATIWHPGLVGSVGADPFHADDKVLCTACELYANERFKLAAIQFRSTIETKLALKFLSDLIECIIPLKLKSLLILGTGFDYELHNILNKNTFYFIANTESSEQIAKATSMKLLEKDHNGKLLVRGSGFGPKLYEALDERIDATLLVKYIAEGENICDAKCFLTKLFQFFNIKEDNVGPVLFPASWHYVYGAPPPLGLF